MDKILLHNPFVEQLVDMFLLTSLKHFHVDDSLVLCVMEIAHLCLLREQLQGTNVLTLLQQHNIHDCYMPDVLDSPHCHCYYCYEAARVGARICVVVIIIIIIINDFVVIILCVAVIALASFTNYRPRLHRDRM